jgi:hypothetical protein
MRSPSTEPPLAELLADPLTLSLMRADRIDPDWLARFLAETARRLPPHRATQPKFQRR